MSSGFAARGFRVMSGLAFVGLVAFLGGLLSLLSWVGWRYFVAPTPAAYAPLAAGFSARPERRESWRVRSGLAQLPSLLHWSVALVLLVGALVVGGVFSLSEWIAPDPLAALNMDRQAHIQAALNPERLVPPPALPPSMFMGSDRPALESADRDWGKLNPRFTQPVLQVLARLQARGYAFALLEGYRSPERQEKLADLGSHVTNARAFQSKHQFGLAVDLAPVRDGKLQISERDPWAMQAYSALGEEAERAGLTWGGRWWFKDYGHVEVVESVAAIGRAAQSSRLGNE